MRILAKEIKDRIEDTPFCKLLGIRIKEVNKGYAKLEMPYKMDLTQPLGFIHGGALASLDWMVRVKPSIFIYYLLSSPLNVLSPSLISFLYPVFLLLPL